MNIPNDVSEFMNMTEPKIEPAEYEKKPDLVPANISGIGLAAVLVGYATQSHDTWVQVACVVCAAAMVIADHVRDAHVRRSRNLRAAQVEATMIEAGAHTDDAE